MADWLKEIVEEAQDSVVDVDLSITVPCNAILTDGSQCQVPAKNHLRVYCTNCGDKSWVFYCMLHTARLRAGMMGCTICYPIATHVLKELTE